MERDLYRLFDYQKFARSDALGRQIDAVHESLSARALSDEEALQVWAAGEPMPERGELPEKRHDKI